jgi:hypothetical protein
MMNNDTKHPRATDHDTNPNRLESTDGTYLESLLNLHLVFCLIVVNRLSHLF